MTTETVARISKHDSAFSRREIPESCIILEPSKLTRAQGRQGADRTHGPRAVKKARGRNHRFSRIIRHSLRDGFNACVVLSLGTGLCCPHRRADRVRATWPQRREARTTRFASASAPFVCTNESCASPIRPSHPRPTCRDDRDTRIEAGCGEENHKFLKNASKLAYAGDQRCSALRTLDFSRA
jgi:hypothetical protein